jgi:hypothetical protein
MFSEKRIFELLIINIKSRRSTWRVFEESHKAPQASLYRGVATTSKLMEMPASCVKDWEQRPSRGETMPNLGKTWAFQLSLHHKCSLGIYEKTPSSETEKDSCFNL